MKAVLVFLKRKATRVGACLRKGVKCNTGVGGWLYVVCCMGWMSRLCSRV